MSRRDVGAVLVLTSLLLFAAPAQAQYTEPGPTSGGSCRPATEESESALLSTTSKSLGTWLERLGLSLRPLPLPRWAARSSRDQLQGRHVPARAARLVERR